MIEHDMMIKKIYPCKYMTAVRYPGGKVAFEAVQKDGTCKAVILEANERLLVTEAAGLSEDLKVQVYELIRREDAK